MHNGIIGGLDHDKDKSDTRTFNDTVLKKLPDNFLDNDGIMSLVESYIESSKLVFLDNKGQTTIVNEQLGEWSNYGNWYSSWYKHASPLVQHMGTIHDWNEYSTNKTNIVVCDECLEELHPNDAHETSIGVYCERCLWDDVRSKYDRYNWENSFIR